MAGRAMRLAILGLGFAALVGAQSITEFTPLKGPGGGITSGPDGNLWFTEAFAIGRITPDGAVTDFSLPTQDFSPDVIVAGPDGNLWFTEQAQHTLAGKIGRITTSGEITEFQAPDGYPDGIAAGPDGNLWFV